MIRTILVVVLGLGLLGSIGGAFYAGRRSGFGIEQLPSDWLVWSLRERWFALAAIFFIIALVVTSGW